jgi:putative sporulation protein YyaC
MEINPMLFDKIPITRALLEAENIMPQKIKYHYQDPYIVERLGFALYRHIRLLNCNFSRPLLIMAIGTDRSTGDCLGPLIGTKLLEKDPQLNLMGTLKDPVHAANLEEKLKIVKDRYKDPIVIALDASLGRTDHIGSITLTPGPLKPGLGVNKSLPEVGEISLTGTVNIGGYMEYFVLQNTRLNLVWEMADIMAQSIMSTFKLLHDNFYEELVKQ